MIENRNSSVNNYTNAWSTYYDFSLTTRWRGLQDLSSYILLKEPDGKGGVPNQHILPPQTLLLCLISLSTTTHLRHPLSQTQRAHPPLSFPKPNTVTKQKRWLPTPGIQSTTLVETPAPEEGREVTTGLHFLLSFLILSRQKRSCLWTAVPELRRWPGCRRDPMT